MFAAMFNRLEIIDLLLAHGADPTCKTSGGATTASLATAMGAHEAAARLANLAS
jgi:ankyrin repeat protein